MAIAAESRRGRSVAGIRGRRCADRPCATLRSTSTLVQETIPVTSRAPGGRAGARTHRRGPPGRGMASARSCSCSRSASPSASSSHSSTPGSGFRVDLASFQGWAGNLGVRGPPRLLRAGLLPRLHARLPLRPVRGRADRPGARRHRRPDQAPGDPRRRRDRLARLVDGPRARRRPAGGAHRGGARRREPGQLVRFGRLWARSIRSASSSCSSACAPCGATIRNGPRSGR